VQALTPYLFFPGTCEQALLFYQDCFQGKIESLVRFKERQQKGAESYQEKIMHSEFKAGNLHFMASDSMPEQTINNGDNIRLSIACDTVEEQERLFKKLQQNGQITMPLQRTFWQAQFGMLTDQFGIHWMFNCPLN